MSSHLILNDHMSDVMLKVHHGGYSWRFSAHSLLLLSRSSIFRELIEDRQEDERPMIITVTGHHPDTILALLRYIYTNEQPTDVTADLLVAAENYGLTDFRDQLEDRLLPNLTVIQACQLLESLELHQPLKLDCAIKAACIAVIEKYAYRVFASDLVLNFSKKILRKLLESDQLNVPDEAITFWGIWRWGRKHCSRNNRSVTDDVVVTYLDGMLSLIRKCDVRKREGIPTVALKSFRCLPRRCKYQPPKDSLEQSHNWRICDSWEDLTDVIPGECGNLCLQVSFDRDVMLVGVTLEMVCAEKIQTYMQLFRESDGRELSRQEIDCFKCRIRKLCRTGEAETWAEADVLLFRPLILPGKEIYSFYLRVSGKSCLLPRTLDLPRKRRINNTTITVHGQAVQSIRELHLVPDLTTSWGVHEIVV